MSQTPTLKLTDPRQEERDSYPLERRRALRHSVSGRVTAVQKPAAAADQVSRICSFQLLNMSNSGLGVLAQDAVELDSSVAVFFPPHGPERGFDLFGTVVRCVRREFGHEIGIRLQVKAAA